MTSNPKDSKWLRRSYRAEIASNIRQESDLEMVRLSLGEDIMAHGNTRLEEIQMERIRAHQIIRIPGNQIIFKVSAETLIFWYPTH